MLTFRKKIFVILLAFVLIPGCTEPRANVAQVTGLVTMKGKHDLRVVTRSYSLSQLSLLKTHETLVP